MTHSSSKCRELPGLSLGLSLGSGYQLTNSAPGARHCRLFFFALLVKQVTSHGCQTINPWSNSLKENEHEHRWPYGRTNGPGKWDKTRLNQWNPSTFSQTDLKRTPTGGCFYNSLGFDQTLEHFNLDPPKVDVTFSGFPGASRLHPIQ